ncbi:phage portal protein [Aureimonas phyllosphaerae]|uniref:HK97 family phage portal protein n=1 Tax=Aureimonas phyllosphaerae TaxID=1166078 RepID=A0A7W6BP16_9HYPH|nr:phage portal protein [Aureimonas phyllosphaerae]MBB3934282.1 HK97 family phage portal protein [Aureimonas phyllosphaerae]MBB3958502.1 HK97 family phage portal protein [Aureimonas phyllosphaerae]SFE98047.1 phage portal protein, HK97 family [Aureimonas phyllosphaerae]
MLGLNTLARRFGLKDSRIFTNFFGTDSWSGRTVTPAKAMQVAAFWACVRIIAQTIATLPVGVYQRRADGGRDAAPRHPLFALLRETPNADQTPVEFLEAIVAHVLVWGNAFVEIVRDDRRILALHILQPDAMEVYRDASGSLRYRQNDPRGVRELDEDQVLHVRGFGFGGDLGLSTVEYARQTLGATMATDEAAARVFANGMRPGGVLTYKGERGLTPAQREQVRESLIAPLTGTENTGRTLLLEGNAGFEWQSVNMPPRDAELLANRAWHVEEVCRWFGVPPILIGHASSGQTMWGSGVEQIMLGWLTLGLRPYLTRLEQAMKRSLLAPEDRATFYVEFTVEGILRADSAGRAEMYSKLMQVGGITPNQIADRENLPRFEGGDVHLVNSTLVPINQAGARPGRVQPAPGEPIPEPGQ